MYIQPVLEGERLIRAGDAATHFYISLSGSFMLYDTHGKALTIHDRGHIMGESTLLGAPVYQTNATALTDGMVLVISWEALQPLMADHFELDQKIASEIKAVIDARQTVFDFLLPPSVDEVSAA